MTITRNSFYIPAIVLAVFMALPATSFAWPYHHRRVYHRPHVRVVPRVVPPVVVRPGPRAYAPAPNTAVAVQRELKQRGYYGGSIDGVIGSGSRSAISAYQADHGLAVTGTITEDLLDELDLD